MRIAQADPFPTNQSLKSAGTILHFMFGGRFGVSQASLQVSTMKIFKNSSKIHFQIVYSK